MNSKKFKNKVLCLSDAVFARNSNRAIRSLKKLYNHASSSELLAFLSFYHGICEKKLGNKDTAEELFLKCISASPEMSDIKSEAWMQLGSIYSDSELYEKACDAYINADNHTENEDLKYKAKYQLAHSRMLSDTVYDTSLFIEPYNYMKELTDKNHSVDPEYIMRACCIAAHACFCINQFSSSAQFCLKALEFQDKVDLPDVLTNCCDMLCDCAVQSWSNSLISKTAKRSYEAISSVAERNEKTEHIRLIYSLSLIRNQDYDLSAEILNQINHNVLSPEAEVCYNYCKTAVLQKNKNAISLNCSFPENNIDDFLVFTESIIDKGFPEAGALIYKNALEIYSSCRALLLRPYASLLYKLERFTESAHVYNELMKEENDPVLYRASSLANLKCGNVDTAKIQLLKYIEISDHSRESLVLSSSLAIDEGYPSDFCASLYNELISDMEKEKTSTEEIVDAYNRLGICLYRCNAPVTDEINAFERAAYHAENNSKLENSNLHAVILCNLAECHMRNNDTDKCFEIYSQADKIFQNTDNVDLIQYSSCLKFISDIHLMNNDIESAEKELKRAILLLEPHAEGDPVISRQLSLCLNTLGTLYFKQNKPELEIPELTRAIDLVKDCPPDPISMSLLYSNRGEAYERIGKYDLMAEDYTVSLTLSDLSENDPINEPDTFVSCAAKWLSIGRYHEETQRHEQAINDYKAALNILKNIDTAKNSDANELVAFAYYQLGNAYCHNNIRDFSSSLSSYTKSIDILDALPSTPSRKIHLASTYDARAAFYEVFGEHQLALADYEKAENLRSLILSEID